MNSISWVNTSHSNCNITALIVCCALMGNKSSNLARNQSSLYCSWINWISSTNDQLTNEVYTGTYLYFRLITGRSTKVLICRAFQVFAVSLRSKHLLGLQLLTPLQSPPPHVVSSQNAVGLTRCIPLQPYWSNTHKHYIPFNNTVFLS